MNKIYGFLNHKFCQRTSHSSIWWWSLEGLPLWNWVGCARSLLTADKNFHDSWFCSWFPILQWNLSGDNLVEQLYLLNITFSCQPLLLLLVRLVAQSRRISAFYTEKSDLILPIFLWLITVHESSHEGPISIQFYTSLSNWIWFGNTPSDGCGKVIEVGTVFSGGWLLLFLASIAFSFFQVLPSCNTSVFCWEKFQWNHVTSQFDVHNVLYLILTKSVFRLSCFNGMGIVCWGMTFYFLKNFEIFAVSCSLHKRSN